MKEENGSGNIFEDLGLADAPDLKLKSTIAGHMNSILEHRHLSQEKTADLLGLSQPKVSRKCCGSHGRPSDTEFSATTFGG
jgi:predicted XRE-type DNA-binding protein